MQNTLISSHEIREIEIALIKPSPENDTLYTPVNVKAADFLSLVQSVRENGILEPLVITLDNFLISGHRRHAAARAARLRRVPCRFEHIYRGDESFLPMLREHNRQRTKNRSEQLREAVVDVKPAAAYQSLLEHREAASRIAIESVAIEGMMHRSPITAAKEPMLQAILKVLQERRRFWPLSDRSIHYALLNSPPLRHARKPDSIYKNDLASYKDLTGLVTRARLVQRIPMEAIADTTRPISIWDVHAAPQPFLTKELNQFLKGYRRNMQQSQPNHIEIVGEKNTVESTLKPIASKFNIPLTIGRGFSSLEPRYKMAQRFKASGKDKLLLLVLTDFDPSGEEIFQSFARSLRDDFGVRHIEPYKVALNAEHVRRFNLPPQMQAKVGDTRTKKFTAKHGANVYELEALPPEVLQSELESAIDSVLDMEAFNAEREAEAEDAAYLENVRRRAAAALVDVA